jgi:NOP5NT (NUC127) domain
VLLSHV